MESFYRLSNSVKNLLFQLPFNCAEICKEISSEVHDNEILQGIIYFLVESWTVVKRKNNKWNFSTSISLPTTCVLDAVEVFCGEKFFCQILLLLPEDQKFSVVKELCILLSTFPNKYYVLRKQFCKEVSTCYINNLLNIPRPVVLSIGCDILNEVLDSLFIKNDHITNILWILAAILDKFCYLDKNGFKFYLNNFNDTTVSNLSLLNLHERERVNKLKQLCCHLEKADDEILYQKRFFENKNIVLVLSKLVFRLSNAFENLQILNIFDEALSEKQFLVILVKLKHATQVISTNQDFGSIYKSFLSASTHFFKVLNLIDFNNETIKYICISASASEILQLRYELTVADCRRKLSHWLELEDEKKKFLFAVHRLNYLYFGHKDILDWLLQLEDLSTENAELWVTTLWTYTICFCCFDVLKRYVEIVNERFAKGLNNVLTKSFQKLILKCVDHLSISSCNILLSELLEHFNSEKLIAWPECEDNPDSFVQNLNEVLNKLTDSDEQSIQLFRVVAQLCLISPFYVLNEVVNRCLRKDLKVSILIKILENMPSLLDLCKKSDVTQLPAVISFSHTSYFLLREKYKSEKVMYHLLVGLVNDSTSVKFLHSIMTWFIYPSLNGSDETLYNINFSLELLETFSALKKIWSIGKILEVSKLLVAFVEEETSNDLVYKNFKSMIGLLTYQYELCVVDESVTVQLKTLADSMKWFNSFYFHKFFKQFNIIHRFRVPKSILVFSTLSNLLYEPVADPFYNTDEGKWQGLIEIYVACQELGEIFIDRIPRTSLDNEIQPIIAAVVNIFGNGISTFKATLVVTYLKKLIEKNKIEDVQSFVSEDLQNANETHDTCFSFLVMVQTYSQMCIQSVLSKNTPDSNVATVLLKILHQFVVNAKEFQRSQVVIFLCLYFFEQLIYAAALLNDNMVDHLELLLVELLRFILDCLKELNDKAISSKVLLKCEETLSMITNRVLNEIFLNEKVIYV